MTQLTIHSELVGENLDPDPAKHIFGEGPRALNMTMRIPHMSNGIMVGGLAK